MRQVLDLAARWGQSPRPMLVRLAVCNLLSFGPMWELDLHGPGRELPDGSQVLERALIVGEAGQGKSNVLKLFALLRQLLLHGNRQGHRPQLPSCRLLDPAQPSTRIELSILASGALFRYQLALRSEPSSQIDAESLFVQHPGQAESMVFVRERKNPILQFTDVKVGDGAGRDRGLLESLALDLSADMPLLTLALGSDGQVVRPIGVWLAETLQLVRPEPRVTGLAARCAQHPDFADKLAGLLQAVGLPVTHVAARRTPIGPDYFENEAEQKQVVSALLGYRDGFVQTQDGELIAEREGNFVDLYLTSLQVGMHGPSGRQSDFAPQELSESTLRLLHLSPLVIANPQQPAPVFFVDDLARGLWKHALNVLLQHPNRPEDAQLVATALPDSVLVGLFPPESIRRLPAS